MEQCEWRVTSKKLLPDGMMVLDIETHFDYAGPRDDAGVPWDKPHADDLTQSHLSALDAELEQAVKGVERTGGWILKKSSSGGSYVYNQRGGGTYHLPDDVAEMLHAFVSGDMLTALRLRDDLHKDLPVAP